MFGAFNTLNRLISKLDSGVPSQQETSSYGFQVLRNPNPELPIEPWFDFIIGINHRRIVNLPSSVSLASTNISQESADSTLFAQEIRNCAGTSVSLDLFSAKGQTTRRITLPIPASNPKLGLTLQYAPISTTDAVYHILSIPPHSPAATAGLLPYSDYIIGTPAGSLHGESAIDELLSEYYGRELKLWVYNSEYDVVREVTVIPSQWAGAGVLGCELNHGFLHRIPAPLSGPVAEPGEVMFEGGGNSFGGGHPRYGQAGNHGDVDEKSGLHFEPLYAPPPQFQVPALGSPEGRFGTPEPLHAQAVGHTQHVAPHRPRKVKEVRGKGLGIDDYFNEGEAKSRELDYVPSKSTGTPPPPPSRSGSQGPPMGGPPGEGPPRVGPPRTSSALSGGSPVTGPPRSGNSTPVPPPVAELMEEDKRPETMESEKSVD